MKVNLHPPPILTPGYFMECQFKSRHKIVRTFWTHSL